MTRSTRACGLLRGTKGQQSVGIASHKVRCSNFEIRTFGYSFIKAMLDSWRSNLLSANHLCDSRSYDEFGAKPMPCSPARAGWDGWIY
jgi:hypothetical protein